MTSRTAAAIEDLLARAKAAHGEYERTELGGVYDEQWPSWYARFLVEHGLADVLGRQVAPETLAEFLTSSWAEQEKSAPTEPWETYTAARIATELAD
jgi:hypothetical protein